MLPFAGTQQAAANVDESQLTRIEAIINSMTNKERHNSSIINGSRKRIAAGCGTSVQEVNNLLRQHTQMAKLFKGIGGMASGSGLKAEQRLLSQMQGKYRFGR